VLSKHCVISPHNRIASTRSSFLTSATSKGVYCKWLVTHAHKTPCVISFLYSYMTMYIIISDLRHVVTNESKEHAVSIFTCTPVMKMKAFISSNSLLNFWQSSSNWDSAPCKVGLHNTEKRGHDCGILTHDPRVWLRVAKIHILERVDTCQHTQFHNF
jgi:hypothetical protein